MGLSGDHQPVTGEDWTAEEVRLVVADYFAMLTAELHNQPYSKAEHNRRLRQHLSARSRGSIEFKHANISAVMISLGLPYVRGYKPRRNFQSRLLATVDEHLAAQPGVYGLFRREADAPSTLPEVPADPAALFQPLPDEIVLPQQAAQPWHSRRGCKLDLVEREAHQRKLGQRGEQFVINLEQRRLRHAGRADLADKVTWAAREWGDGLGFDVLSFHAHNDQEQFIEVKTTNQGRHFPFYLTRTELRCSSEAAEQFQLYRVFDFRRDVGVYVVEGDLRRSLHLEPETYRVATA